MLYITNNTFFHILLNSLEAYPHEATGELFGFRHNEPDTVDYEITQAVPQIQAKFRGTREFQEKYPPKFRLKDSQIKLFGYVDLGGFHSHPDDDAEISEDDRKYLKSGGIDFIEVIIGIEEKKKFDEDDLIWNIYEDDKVLEGMFALGDKAYLITMRAYIFHENEVQNLDLRCEFIEVIEKLNKYGFTNLQTIGELYRYGKSIKKDDYEIYNLLCQLEENIDEKKSKIKKIVKELYNYLHEK